MPAAKDIYFRNTFYAVPYISSFTPLTVNGLDDALLTLPVCCNLSFQLPIGFSSQVACKLKLRISLSRIVIGILKTRFADSLIPPRICHTYSPSI